MKVNATYVPAKSVIVTVLPLVIYVLTSRCGEFPHAMKLEGIVPKVNISFSKMAY